MSIVEETDQAQVIDPADQIAVQQAWEMAEQISGTVRM